MNPFPCDFYVSTDLKFDALYEKRQRREMFRHFSLCGDGYGMEIKSKFVFLYVNVPVTGRDHAETQVWSKPYRDHKSHTEKKYISIFQGPTFSRAETTIKNSEVKRISTSYKNRKEK